MRDRFRNEEMGKDATNAGMDPPGGKRPFDKEAFMQAADERYQKLIDYWREQGRDDMVAELRRTGQ